MNEQVEILRNALLPVCEKAKAEGRKIGDVSFRHCPLGLLFEHHFDGAHKQMVLSRLSTKLEIPVQMFWAFIDGFDNRGSGSTDALREPEFYMLGREFREKYLSQ